MIKRHLIAVSRAMLIACEGSLKLCMLDPQTYISYITGWEETDKALEKTASLVNWLIVFHGRPDTDEGRRITHTLKRIILLEGLV